MVIQIYNASDQTSLYEKYHRLINSMVNFKKRIDYIINIVNLKVTHYQQQIIKWLCGEVYINNMQTSFMKDISKEQISLRHFSKIALPNINNAYYRAKCVSFTDPNFLNILPSKCN